MCCPKFHIGKRFYIIHEIENKREIIESQITGIYGKPGIYNYKIEAGPWCQFWVNGIDISEQELVYKIKTETMFFEEREIAKRYIEKTLTEYEEKKKKEKEAKNKRIKLILLQIIKEQHESLSDYMDAKFKGNDITNYNNIITNYYMENGKLKKAPTLPELIIFYTSQARVFFDKNRTDEKILNEMYKLIYSDAELRESIYDNLKLCTYICGWYDSSLFQVSEALSSATKKEIKKIIHDAIW